MGASQHKQMWNISKWRFLQSEAQFWIVPNWLLEFAAFGGLALAAWMHLDPSLTSGGSKLFVFVVALGAALARDRRSEKWSGYFDGYEQGFIDAARGDLGFSSMDEEDSAIRHTLDEIESNERMVGVTDKAARDAQIRKGRSKAIGLLSFRFMK